MSITGGIKIFDKSKSLFKDGASAIASSNSSNADNILNYNKFTSWESIGSDDLTTETIEITFDSVAITRLFLININFKEFIVEYWSGSAWVDFTNVITIDNSIPVTGISETIWDKDTGYYEFDSVTTTKIRISTTKTQSVDAEKEIFNCYVSTELGTFLGYPSIPREDTNNNNSVFTVLSGKVSILKGLPSVSFSLSFKIYPYEEDYDLITNMIDRNNSFLVWLCGGKYGTKNSPDSNGNINFKMNRENWRLKDVYNMQSDSQLNLHWYTSNNGTIYVSGFTGNIRLKESV